jgi:hypothetical protein
MRVQQYALVRARRGDEGRASIGSSGFGPGSNAKADARSVSVANEPMKLIAGVAALDLPADRQSPATWPM